MIEINVIKNQIHSIFNNINILKKIFKYDEKKYRLEEINKILKQNDIWNNPSLAKTLNKEFVFIENLVKKIDNLIINMSDITEFFELVIDNFDESILNYIVDELKKIEIKIKDLEFIRVFSGKNDINNCYIDLQAGSGGIEAQDWTSMLMKMYLKWAEYKKFKTEIITLVSGEVAGIKSVTIKVIGEYAYGWLRTETGIHRLVRKSPFDSGNRRHTSFSSSFIYPDNIDNNVNIIINSSDLRIDAYRSSGAGGQHVNKTESAIRITHLPTGMVVQCQSDRSQHKNKETALKQLKNKLYNLEIKKKQSDKEILEQSKSEICWGNQIRSYILDDSRIKDLRTGVENCNIHKVLNGDLDIFIKASLRLGL